MADGTGGIVLLPFFGMSRDRPGFPDHVAGAFARQRSECRRALRSLYRPGKRAMSISQAISSHIPYLRRFARALAGTQAGGDAYVLATLEAIVADPSELGDTVDLRAALYRVFLAV